MSTAQPLEPTEADTSAGPDIHTTAGKLALLHGHIEEAVHAGSQKAIDLQHSKGKMTARERIAALGLETWFHPSVAVSRRGVERTLDGKTVIEKGDLIWTDFGIRYLRLDQIDMSMATIVCAMPFVLPLVYFMVRRLSVSGDERG